MNKMKPSGSLMNQVLHDGPLFDNRVDAKDLGLSDSYIASS